jgi:hypothetical protein
LRAKPPEARLPVGGVFLAAHDAAGVVEDDMAAPEVIAEEELHVRAAILWSSVAGTHDGDASGAVRDVNVVVLPHL